MKVIFLDIDGVLNSLRSAIRYGNFDHFSREAVKALNILTDATGAKLVISSTWRIARKDYIDVLRANGVMGEIIGATPNLSHDQNGVCVGVIRGFEIKVWLEDHPDVEDFIILDDDNDMGELLNHLVQTNPDVGLTFDDAKRAIGIMR
jgi:hypothetical protein